VTGRLADEVDGLRRALGAMALQRIAPHCTLVPPVNVRDEDMSSVLEHVRAAAARSSAIAVELGPPATFWPRTPVLYLSVGGDLEAIAELRVDLATGPLSPPEERRERDFVPQPDLGPEDRSPPGWRMPSRLWPTIGRRTASNGSTLLEQDAEHRWWPLADTVLGRPAGRRARSFDLELSVVERPDPAVAAWVEEQWAGYLTGRYGPGARPNQPFLRSSPGRAAVRSASPTVRSAARSSGSAAS